MRKVNIMAAALLCVAATGIVSADAWNKKNQGNLQRTCSVARAEQQGGPCVIGAGNVHFPTR